MSFDPSKITSTNPKVTFTDSGLEFDDAAGAIKAARERDGDEVVVGYVNESGDLKYALVDARKAGSHSKQVANFSPDQLGFADGGHVATAFTVNDDNNFDFVTIAAPPATGDPAAQTEAALDLARAATAKEVGRHGFIHASTPGFRYEHSNLDWGRMVRSNKVTVLDHVVTTIARLDAQVADLSSKRDAARAAGNPDEAAALEQQLARLNGQRSELDVHQAMLRAELLTDSVNRPVKIPGTDNGTGDEQFVGEFRSTFPKALGMLHDRLAQVEQDLAVTTDPAARRSLESQAGGLKQTITQLEQARAGIQEAAMHQGYRETALSQIGGGLADVNRDLTDRQATLASLQKQADAIQNSGKPYAVRASELAGLQTQIETQRKAIDAKLASLITVMEKEIEVYAEHSGSGTVPQAAVALLRNELSQLKDLQQNGGMDLAALARTVTGTLSVIQTENAKLIAIVSKGSQKWDGVSPKEGLELLQINASAATYKQAYSKADAQVAVATSKAAVPPENHILTIQEGKDYQDQGDYNSCGTTSLTMVLNHINKVYPIPEKARDVVTIDNAIRPNDRGHGLIDSFTAPNDIEDYAEDLGMTVRQTNGASTDDLKKMIDQGVPPMILTDWEPYGTPSGDSLHYVVVKGYRTKDNGETEWIIENPNGYEDQLDTAQLMKVWSNLEFNNPGPNISTGYNRLMISVIPPSGSMVDGNGDKHPVSTIQLPPERKPVVMGAFIEIVNEAAGIINDGAEVVHDIKDGAVDVINTVGDAVEDAVGYVIDNPLSIIASPIRILPF